MFKAFENQFALLDNNHSERVESAQVISTLW